MIKILITINQTSKTEINVRGKLEANVVSSNPLPEEITIAAKVMEKLRQIGEEIGKEDDVSDVTMFERIYDVRLNKQEGDRHPDIDSGQKPGQQDPP